MDDETDREDYKTYKSELDKVAAALSQLFEREEPDRLKRWRSLHPRFRERFDATWGAPLDALELFVADAMLVGSRFNDQHREAAAREGDARFDAVTRLHGKACQVALEALALMRAGLADGAMARWRTLHETTVVALFLSTRDRELSRRYLLHVTAAAARIGKAYRDHQARLRFEAPTPEDLARLEAARAALDAEFGGEFSRADYGWCASEFPGTGRVGIHHLEESVGLAHWYPLYLSACLPVHAASRSLSTSIAAPEGEHTRSIFCGYSNLGIDTVGGLVAHSLVKATAALTVLRETEDPVVFAENHGWLAYLKGCITKIEFVLGDSARRLAAGKPGDELWR